MVVNLYILLKMILLEIRLDFKIYIILADMPIG